MVKLTQTPSLSDDRGPARARTATDETDAVGEATIRQVTLRLMPLLGLIYVGGFVAQSVVPRIRDATGSDLAPMLFLAACLFLAAVLVIVIERR